MGKVSHASAGTKLDQDEWESDSTHTVGGVADLDIVRTATYVIAASDAPSHVKAQADIVCGTDYASNYDNLAIQAAIDANSNSNKSIQLLGETFTLADSFTPNQDQRVFLVGEGRSITTLTNSSGHVIDFTGTGGANDLTRLYLDKLSLVSGADHALYGYNACHWVLGAIEVSAPLTYYGAYFSNSLKNHIKDLKVTGNGNGLAIVADDATFNPGNFHVSRFYCGSAQNIGILLQGADGGTSGRVNLCSFSHVQAAPSTGDNTTAIKFIKAQYNTVFFLDVEAADYACYFDGYSDSADYSLGNRVLSGSINSSDIYSTGYALNNHVLIEQETNNFFSGDITYSTTPSFNAGGALAAYYPNVFGNQINRPFNGRANSPITLSDTENTYNTAIMYVKLASGTELTSGRTNYTILNNLLRSQLSSGTQGSGVSVQVIKYSNSDDTNNVLIGGATDNSDSVANQLQIHIDNVSGGTYTTQGDITLLVQIND